MSADRHTHTHTHQLMSYELVYTSIHSSIICYIHNIYTLYNYYAQDIITYIYTAKYTRVCTSFTMIAHSWDTKMKVKLGLWLRLECSLDSLSIDSAHVIYVSEGYDVAYNRRTASQPSHVVLRVTWYVKTFRNVNYVC